MLKRGFYLGVAAVLALAGAALAGDYHQGATLICADCHIMHGSQSHGYNDDGSGIYVPVGDEAPYVYLLRDEVNELCLGCHNNQAWAPDVMEANTGSAVRLAGALNSPNSAGPYYPEGGHTLWSTDVAPGGTWSNPEGMTCIDCHYQHGRSTNTYRNLIAFGGSANAVTYAVGTNDPTKDVFERAAAGYDISNVDYNEPNTAGSKMGTFCKNCHTDFHGSAADANMRDQGHSAGQGWVRHPAADANIGAQGGGHSSLSQFRNKLYRTKVMSASGDWGTQGVAWPSAPADLTPSCFSCHKSHGNKHAFGIIHMTGNAPPGEDGDATSNGVKNICKQCHIQG